MLLNDILFTQFFYTYGTAISSEIVNICQTSFSHRCCVPLIVAYPYGLPTHYQPLETVFTFCTLLMMFFKLNFIYLSNFFKIWSPVTVSSIETKKCSKVKILFRYIHLFLQSFNLTINTRKIIFSNTQKNTQPVQRHSQKFCHVLGYYITSYNVHIFIYFSIHAIR